MARPFFLFFFLASNLAHAANLTLSWNANNEFDLAEYRVYYGTSPRTSACPPGGYSSSINVGNVTSYTLIGLMSGATYYFSATASDTTGNESCFSSEVSYVIPTQDITPPTVTLTAPSNNETVSGTVTISATASDPSGPSGQVMSGVSGIQFLLDGVAFGTEDSAAPYSVSWNTANSVNGSYMLAARARDAAGNSTLSGQVAVTVQNTALCVENWVCANWSSCSGGNQSRTCTDGNNCDTTTQRPALTQTCTSSVPGGGASGGTGGTSGATGGGSTGGTNGGTTGGTSGGVSVAAFILSLTAFTTDGTAPLRNVTLRANASQEATVPISYTLYCNRPDAGTNVTAGYGAQFLNTNNRIWFFPNACSYETPGLYTPKVIAVSQNGAAEARATVTVRNAQGEIPGIAAGGSLVTPPGTPQISQFLKLFLSKNLFLGLRDSDVTRLQTFLKQLGFFPVSEETTTFFGRITLAAVQAYQRTYGIVASGDSLSTGYGTVGPKTRTHMAQGVIPRTATATSPARLFRGLAPGMSGEDVRYLQERLKALGFFLEIQEATGYFGSLTLGAVKKFQCARRILCSGDPETTGYGLVGPRTRAMLE